MKKSMLAVLAAGLLLAACDKYGEGRKHLKDGQFEKAAIYFKNRVQKNPNDAYAHNELGFAYLKLGMMAEAEDEFGKALAIKPDYFEARFNRGTALMNLRRYNEASKVLGEALKQKPDHVPALINHAWSALIAGDLDAAETNFKRLRELSPLTDLKDLETTIAEAKRMRSALPPAPAAGSTADDAPGPAPSAPAGATVKSGSPAAPAPEAGAAPR
jgi:Flp pilus assembly protein TadD